MAETALYTAGVGILCIPCPTGHVHRPSVLDFLAHPARGGRAQSQAVHPTRLVADAATRILERRERADRGNRVARCVPCGRMFEAMTGKGLVENACAFGAVLCVIREIQDLLNPTYCLLILLIAH